MGPWDLAGKAAALGLLKAVAKVSLGEQVLRRARIGLQFLAEFTDERSQVLPFFAVLGAPHGVQEFGVCDRHPGVRHQIVDGSGIPQQVGMTPWGQAGPCRTKIVTTGICSIGLFKWRLPIHRQKSSTSLAPNFEVRQEVVVAKADEAGGEGGIRTHVPAFGRQDAFEAPPL